ncbi:OB-fold domain-containing protein [Phytohabitans suffuscus]|nr:OB-fold domain-containing protein [Phytohabitans suffuscus]
MGNIVDCDPEEVAVGARVRAFVMRANPDVGIPQWRLAR